MGLLRCILLSALVGTGCRQVLGLEDVECTPTYAAAVDYPTATGPRVIGVGDLSGDGRLDMATVNSAGNISRFDGIGDATVMTRTDYDAIANPVDMVVGDLTGDGLADIAVLGNNNGLAVLRSEGATLVRDDKQYNVDNGRDLEIVDLDGNGVMDLLGTSNGTTLPTTPAKLNVLLAKPDGTLSLTPYDAPENPNLIRVGDFNADGTVDVLLTSRNENPTVIRLGIGNGMLGEPIDTGLQLTTRYIVVGDVNNDGKPDLVVSNADANGVLMTAVVPGNGDGTFAAGTQSTDELVPTALADIDNDGILDLVGHTLPGQAGMASIGVRLGIGDGTFGPMSAFALSAQPVDAIAAKLDSDSILDLVAVLGTTNNIAIVDGKCSLATK